MQAYKRQAYLCSLLKLIHDRNYNIMIIIRLLGKTLHVLAFGMAKQNFSVKDERYFKAFFFLRKWLSKPVLWKNLAINYFIFSFAFLFLENNTHTYNVFSSNIIPYFLLANSSSIPATLFPLNFLYLKIIETTNTACMSMCVGPSAGVWVASQGLDPWRKMAPPSLAAINCQ